MRLFGVNISASTSAADPLSLLGEYDVFLSFCGQDTRKCFTDFLYTFLLETGVRTFRDNEDLHVGEEIGPELLKAITDSKISIPIFSKNYASSKWCLFELAQMVKCQEKGAQMIFPIFYDVDPCDVRHQSGSYEEAFRQHRKRRYDEKTIQEWKEALTKVGQLKGLELKKETDGHQGEFVKIVVKEVLSKLKKNYKHIPENLVGMDGHIEEMERLLNIDSNGIRIIGILGMGGLGKTTIAKVIYNQMCELFECHCFLEDVRENSNSNAIVKLQNQLVSQILKKESKFDNVDQGINKIKGAIHKKKVLIVLDDVDNKIQIDKLVGKHSWYESGSRIIITTRDEEILLTLEITCQNEGLHEVYRCYRPKLMDKNAALQLFNKYAFMRDSPPKGYDALAMEVVSSAGGLPLVLKTIGSLLLIEKDKVSWQDKLKKLQAIPPKEVLERLKISYDALDDVQKQIFLDIACFFSRDDKTNPYYMWDDCEFYPGEGIIALVRRSLITVGDDNRLWMHDKLRELGEQIIYGKYQDKPEKGSRLWRPEDTWDLLENQLGTENVKLLYLDRRYDRGYDRGRLRGEDFRKLPNLRYLSMNYVDLDGDFKNLLQNLIWLQWWDFSGKCAPTNLHLKNLVVLDLSKSYIREDWGGWSQIKMSNKLKVLNLSSCGGLTRIPHLSAFPTLERLKLFYCESLCRLDGLEELESLKYLNASHCHALESLPDLSKLTSLRTLDVEYCKKLTEIQGLDRLSPLKEIQEKMSNKLKVLDLTCCENITRIPHLSEFPTLERLELGGCNSLRRLDGLDELESLKYLNASYCYDLESLPDLSKLTSLQTLDVNSCKKLTEIQGLDKLESLGFLDMSYCTALERLPHLSNLQKLTSFDSSWCEKLVEIQDDWEGWTHIKMSNKLKVLDLTCCENITIIPHLSAFPTLERLEVFECSSLCRLDGLEELESLKYLNASYCFSLESLPNLSKLTSLQTLYVNSCEKLTEIQGLSKLTSLQTLYVNTCFELTEIQGLDKLASLEFLDTSWSRALERLPNLSNLQKLTRFDLSWCEKLVEIQGLDRLTSLEQLDIEGCKSLKSLPDLSDLTNLKELNVSHCVKLTELQGLEELKFLKELRVTGCESLENLPNLPNIMIQKDSEDKGFFIFFQ